MTSPTATSLPDVQSHGDQRAVAIDRVGISSLRWPLVVLDRQQRAQSTVATLAISVGLPHRSRGTHMSRFIEVLNEHRGELTMRTLPAIMVAIRERLEAETARMEISFPYFLDRCAPISGATAPMGYDCTFVSDSGPQGDDFVLGVRVPVTSLCPCSKAMSEHGAHNQRGTVAIEVRSERPVGADPAWIWIEELIEIAEASASAPVYPLLKRADERHVTMQAYDNPAFVEDIVRNVAVRLRADERVSWFRATVTNMESIHDHDAFAMVEWARHPETVAGSIGDGGLKLRMQ